MQKHLAQDGAKHREAGDQKRKKSSVFAIPNDKILLERSGKNAKINPP